ncbi:MAG: bifunctional DNA primase/polymerase [Thermofilum sp.]|uniref:bifunctional DNA primase/polymerase n=1 Tax=Thermofilum sp. TaxID=1961369 RepID=UPI0025911385|nr:bifunctional DNA primase/polymerase [Thermofilum sp.]MCI4409728.1 bifunctional DNA primase/polymerase [Thermofilum sp.]
MEPKNNNRDPTINISPTVDGLEFTEYVYGYLDAGLSIFPIDPSGEKVLVRDWRQYIDRRPAFAEIGAWLDEYRWFNIGLALGGVSRALAIMFPTLEHARAWFKSLNELQQISLVSFGLVVRVMHGDKLRNVYFVLQSEAEDLVPVGSVEGVDGARILGKGEYVLLPPSQLGTLSYRLWEPWRYNVKRPWISPLPREPLEKILGTFEKKGWF